MSAQISPQLGPQICPQPGPQTGPAPDPPSRGPPRGRAGRRAWVLGLFGLIGLALLWGVHDTASRYFLQETAARGRVALNLHVENLRGWLGRYRALPGIYANSSELVSFLRAPGDAALLRRANVYLEEANLATGASETYVLGPDGSGLAASNWADEKSFIGQSYAFRPYYSQAMEGRLGRFFALGTVSGKRGYYFAHPVRDGGAIVGVVVVKVGVEGMEAEMRASAYDMLVAGQDGVVLLAGRPEWQLKTLRPLDAAALERIRRNRQFDAVALEPIDLVARGDSAIGEPLVELAPGSEGAGSDAPGFGGPESDGEAGRQYLLLTQAMAREDWAAHLLIGMGFARTQALTITLLAAVVWLALGMAVAMAWQWRQRFVDRLLAKEETKERLERAVAQRTADLINANRQLEQEIGERIGAEQELRRTQAELVQAGKLAALGQMSAALSHEFNQPLTAIRTYADNAVAFLERGRDGEAQANISRISSLTQRMAELSKHLSSFARKPQDKSRPVSLSGALGETLALLQGRLEASGIAPALDLPDGEVWVQGGHTRLQQVMMNLITNALDAMRDANEPAEPALRIAIVVGGEASGVAGGAASGGEVRLVVEDRGAGIAPETMEAIFDPFFTTKSVGEGLGLGLTISYNIVRDFGGTIAAENRSGGGARFTVTLKAARPVEGDAPEVTRPAEFAAE